LKTDTNTHNFIRLLKRQYNYTQRNCRLCHKVADDDDDDDDERKQIGCGNMPKST